MDKEQKFREDLVGLGADTVNKVKGYFSGKELSKDMLQTVTRVMGYAVKVSHMNQHAEIQKRSQAIRLLSFIPPDRRGEYIALTNPEARPFLLDRPENDTEAAGAA